MKVVECCKENVIEIIVRIPVVVEREIIGGINKTQRGIAFITGSIKPEDVEWDDMKVEK